MRELAGWQTALSRNGGGTMESDYIEPTAATRRKAMALVAVAGAVAAVAQFWLAPRFFAFVNALPVCERLPWLRGMLIGLIAVVPLFGLYGIWLACRVLLAGQWPLPNAPVWRRTRIRRGRAARWRAGMLLLAASVAASFPLLAWHGLGRSGLLSPPAQCATDAPTARASTGLTTAGDRR